MFSEKAALLFVSSLPPNNLILCSQILTSEKTEKHHCSIHFLHMTHDSNSSHSTAAPCFGALLRPYLASFLVLQKFIFLSFIWLVGVFCLGCFFPPTWGNKLHPVFNIGTAVVTQWYLIIFQFIFYFLNRKFTEEKTKQSSKQSGKTL